jgi:hypothetical protein
MEDRDMFKKNLFLICALTAVSVAITADTFHEDEIVDVTKGKKKCCRCCSLRVTNNVTVGGSVTANNFINATTGLPVITGARNYAVFSNNSDVDPDTIVPFGSTPLFPNTTGITNNAGVITLPVGGVFAVTYAVRFTLSGSGAGVAQLQQGAGATFANIPPAINNTGGGTDDSGLLLQATGFALIAATSTANNQIRLLINFLDAGITLPASAVPSDANAQIMITQLN